MNQYQLAVVLKNDLSDKARTDALVAITGSFGKLIKEDLWGSRNLTYEIKHNPKGFYAYYEFEAEPKTILKLDRDIRLNEDILRHLLLKKAEVKSKK